ncbi:uncharacterized protein BJX67DRAFT_3426 [Aspergillus lucknowensis]|uniref:Secreted protein n=1 Tax=Aspergillus lucknowensis TaxID=176173 RepID=A0ABR4M6W3_9EURO
MESPELCCSSILASSALLCLSHPFRAFFTGVGYFFGCVKCRFFPIHCMSRGRFNLGGKTRPHRISELRSASFLSYLCFGAGSLD